MWPLYVPNRSPLWENQTFTTWSFDVEKRRSPSGLNTTCVRDRSWPCRRIGLYFRLAFEEEDGDEDVTIVC